METVSMLLYEILSFAQAVLSVFCGSINGNLLSRFGTQGEYEVLFMGGS